MQPWADVLAGTFFTPLFPASTAAQRERAWNILDPIASLDGAVAAVVRAWRLPLREQLRRTVSYTHLTLPTKA